MKSIHVLTQVVFKDRRDAGILLAEKLPATSGEAVCILGLARGGVAVAAPIVGKLKRPLDVLVVKKLSSPENSEFALGAVAPDGVSLVHWQAAHRAGADEAYVRRIVASLSDEIRRNMLRYRKGKKPFQFRDQTVVLVDDGAATGATMEAAIRWAKSKHAGKIVVALPVASDDAMTRIRPEADVSIVIETDKSLTSVGQYYTSFPQVTDQEVIELLNS